MKAILALIVLIAAPLIMAEQPGPLPRFSVDRFLVIDGVLSKIKFPIPVKSLCTKLGGESSIRWAAYSSSADTLTGYFSVSEEVSSGVFQIEMVISGKEESIPERACTSARLVYIYEGMLFRYDEGYPAIPKQKPNHASEPTSGLAPGRGSL